jgi:hypothetical protein
MKEERLICPTTPKLSHVTERCLKTKLQLYTKSRNGTYILLAIVYLPPIYLERFIPHEESMLSACSIVISFLVYCRYFVRSPYSEILSLSCLASTES